jgi:hypothetical protein
LRRLTPGRRTFQGNPGAANLGGQSTGANPRDLREGKGIRKTLAAGTPDYAAGSRVRHGDPSTRRIGYAYFAQRRRDPAGSCASSRDAAGQRERRRLPPESPVEKRSARSVSPETTHRLACAHTLMGRWRTSQARNSPTAGRNLTLTNELLPGGSPGTGPIQSLHAVNAKRGLGNALRLISGSPMKRRPTLKQDAIQPAPGACGGHAARR